MFRFWRQQRAADDGHVARVIRQRSVAEHLVQDQVGLAVAIEVAGGGAVGERVAAIELRCAVRAEDLRDTLARALRSNGPMLVEIEVQ